MVDLDYASSPAPAPAPAVTLRPASGLTRIWCGLLLLTCGVILGIGLWLSADPHGVNTHVQLGQPPCGFLEHTGYPCMTCGCTTAVTLFAHGHWGQALYTQPFGFVFGLINLAGVVLGAAGVLMGRWYGPSGLWLYFKWPWWLGGLVAAMLGGWIYKIALMRWL